MCIVAIHWLDDNGDGDGGDGDGDGGDGDGDGGDGGDDGHGGDDVGVVEEAVIKIKRRKEELTCTGCS